MGAARQLLHEADQGKIRNGNQCSPRPVLDFDLVSQSIGKEFITLTNPNDNGGSGLTRYRFNATKTGKATLTFIYGYTMLHPPPVEFSDETYLLTADGRPPAPGPGDTVKRVHVHIAISKSLTTPAPLIVTTTPAPIPLPSTTIEAYLSASSDPPTYEVRPQLILFFNGRTYR